MRAKSSIQVAVLHLLVLAAAILGCSALKLSMMVAFGVAMIPVLSLCLFKGVSPKEIANQTGRALWEVRMVFAVITLLGASISVWLSSGTVAFLMDQGMAVAKGPLFLAMAYLLSALCSLMIGTAVGTFSTFGLAFIGMGKALGVPEGILVGTIVSGVFMADRIAPMSGLVNLIVRQTGITFSGFLRASWKRIALAVALCLAVYIPLGFSLNLSSGAESGGAMVAGFHLSGWLWMMPVLMLLMALRGIPTLWTLGMGVVSGFLLTLIVQGSSLESCLSYIAWGFSSAQTPLKGGGVLPMLEVIGIVAMAVIYNQLLAIGGITRSLLEAVTQNCTSLKGLLRRMGGLSIVLTSLTCDQTVGILLPIKAMERKDTPIAVAPEHRAMLVGDTGVLIAPLEPWNVNALIILALTGVPAWQYGPWAIFCWIMPLLAFWKPAGIPETPPLK